MIKKKGIKKTCPNGHEFYKNSDCPACPICEQAKTPEEGFLSLFVAPARRALENAGITSAQKLAKYSQKEILKFHGMGPASLPNLKKALIKEGLDFRRD